MFFEKENIADPLMHRYALNKGERTQYYIEDCYPAIVSKEEWQVVQEMMNRADKTRRLNTAAHPFVGKMYCAVCGRAFNQSLTGAMNRTRKRLFCCISRKDRTGVEVPDMPPVRVRAPKRPNGTGCAPVEAGVKKKPAMRPYLCSDTSLEIDEPMNTDAGDIILYQGRQFVIYYDQNSWSLTPLGKITGLTKAELQELLGTGNVTAVLALSNP